MSFTTTDANVRISVEEAKHGNGFCTAADLLRYRLYDSYLSLIKVAAAGTLPSRDSKSSMSISESESEDNTHNGRRGKHRHTPLRQRSRSPNTRSPRKNACSPKERYDPAYPTTPEGLKIAYVC